MKIFSISRTLDKKQWSGFLTYVQLYHKPESIVGKVSLWLDEADLWKSPDDEDFTAEALSKIIPFEIKPQILSNALYKLGNVAEEFLGWLVWKDSGNQKTVCQLHGLAQKSLYDQFLKTKRQEFEKPKDKMVSIWDDHFKLMVLFDDYYYGVSSSEDDNYVDVFEDLLKMYVKSSKRIGQLLLVEIKNRERLLSESWEKYESYMQKFNVVEDEFDKMMNHLMRLNSDGDLDSYNYLKKILLSNKIENYTKFVQYCISTYYKNFLTTRIKQGETFRQQEILHLYEYVVEKEIFNLNNTIPLIRFVNIISVASKLGKSIWARKIVDEWAWMVESKNQKSIASFGHATIDFHEKKYQKVVERISNLKSSSYHHKLRFRWLLLIAQYELNKEYGNLIKAQIDNFRRFISSNEKRINKQTYYAIKSTLRLLTMVMNKKPKEEVLQSYQNSKYVYERKWILEKIKNPVS